MKTQIIVTSSSPKPRFCAGVMFEGAMTFAPDAFNAAQLRQIMADRLLTVVVGEVLAPEDVDAFVAQHAPAAKAGGKK